MPLKPRDLLRETFECPEMLERGPWSLVPEKLNVSF